MKTLQVVYLSSDCQEHVTKLLSESCLVRDLVRLGFQIEVDSDVTKIILPGQAFRVSEVKDFDSYDNLVLTHGGYFTKFNKSILDDCLEDHNYDILGLKAEPELNAYTEHPKITSDGRIAGFSRSFDSHILEMPKYQNMVHSIVVRKKAFSEILPKLENSQDFGEITKTCIQDSNNSSSFHLAGEAIELKTLCDFHTFIKTISVNPEIALDKKYSGSKIKCTKVGKLFSEHNVKVDSSATIIGPVVFCEGVEIGAGAVIKDSILGNGVKVEDGSYVNGVELQEHGHSPGASCKRERCASLSTYQYSCKGFRRWKRFSYAGLGKRIFDIVFSLTMIILLGPVWLIIIAAIKLNSPGPLFYKAKRQGLEGKEFNCLKFRSMMVGADDIQDTLRVKNEVDGPQFKIEKDPRISSVGKFLRDTSLDEIPQFFNVLGGSMSVVGPRPSPEDENLKCPYWRDARLSARPGITGLWQIMRTREPAKDFQEWVYYDTKYVRNMSLKFDLWICCKTAMKLINDFFNKF